MSDPEDSFDGTFDFKSEVPSGKDPDSYSPTLRRWHQMLWSKPLNSGEVFQLEPQPSLRKGYLTRSDASGNTLWLGSDAITNSYSGWMRPKGLVEARAALNEVQRLRYLHPPYTIGSAMIWPLRSTDRPTMNQARGTRSKIADRMDLTLECIRRHYSDEADSPLADVIAAYGDFFGLFENFRDFVDYFLFQDLVTDDYRSVRFYLPFDNFTKAGAPQSLDEYVTYREATLAFIDARGQRMVEWVNAQC